MFGTDLIISKLIILKIIIYFVNFFVKTSQNSFKNSIALNFKHLLGGDMRTKDKSLMKK